MMVRNVGLLQMDYTALYPRRKVLFIYNTVQISDLQPGERFRPGVREDILGSIQN
jgi:hypothetical protein